MYALNSSEGRHSHYVSNPTRGRVDRGKGYRRPMIDTSRIDSMV